MTLVTVILCCTGEHDLTPVLEAFNEQDWPHRELIVVSTKPLGLRDVPCVISDDPSEYAMILRGVQEANGEFCILWSPKFTYYADALRVQANASDYKSVVTMCQGDEHVSFSFARRNADKLHDPALGRRYIDSGHGFHQKVWTPPAVEPPVTYGFGQERALNVMCPAGIGDVLWILSKFAALAQEREIVFWLPAGEQHRAGGLCRMAGVHYAYLPTLTTQWVWSQPGSPEIPESGWIAVQANRHLEAGKHLKDWYPELPLAYPELSVRFQPKKADYVIGFMCLATYMGGQLQPKEWAAIFEYVEKHVAPVVIVGAGRDVDFAREVMKFYKSPLPPLFDAPLEEVLPTVLGAKAVVGVASGLLISGITYGKPSLIAYPRWLTSMPGTWEPPSSRWSWCLTENLPDKVFSGALQDLLK
jgi:hypothetical protein